MTTEISVRVHPKAAKSGIIGITDGVWQIRVAAPPVKGKANKELIDLLSKLLEVGRSRLSVVKGHTSRNKVVAVAGLSQEDITERLLPP